MNKTEDFSTALQAWLGSKKLKTLGSMLDVLGEKSFAFLFLVLMIFPAAPLPTGGVTHIFEIVVALVALQLVIGRSTIWLPRRLSKIELNQVTLKKILPFLARAVRFAEKYSRPRLALTLQKKWFKVQLGIVVLLLSAGAFLAPPFTGLDTLPSLGVVFIAIGIILNDIVIIGLGYVIGLTGVAVALLLGVSIFEGLIHLF